MVDGSSIHAKMLEHLVASTQQSLLYAVLVIHWTLPLLFQATTVTFRNAITSLVLEQDQVSNDIIAQGDHMARHGRRLSTHYSFICSYAF